MVSEEHYENGKKSWKSAFSVPILKPKLQVVLWCSRKLIMFWRGIFPQALDGQEIKNGGKPLKGLEDYERSITFSWGEVILLFIFPALGGTLYGYDIGVASAATLSLKSASLSGMDWYELSYFQDGLVSSGSLFGALFGSLLAFTSADFLGRRRELITASLLYTIGAVIAAAAPTFGVLVVGRLVYGLGIGMEALSPALIFLVFGIHALVALVFIVLKVPETKGLSLEEIEAKLSS